MSLPTLARVQELLNYDPATGIFTWRVPTSRKIRAGAIAGTIQSGGYRQITIDGKRLLAGRLAWFFANGCWPSNEIDHVNGDRDDDRLCNLREATRSQNNRNRRAYGKSGIKGAFWVAKQGKWRASIKTDGRVVLLGMFETAEAAGAAYAAASTERYGDFARVA